MVCVWYSESKDITISNSNKLSGESHSISIERLDFQKALQKAKYAESTQRVYLRSFDQSAERLDRKTPATATVKEANRHLTELKQSGATDTAYGNASATHRTTVPHWQRNLRGTLPLCLPSGKSVQPRR
jgi:bisphosphoglycerate-dependent phosphoglycerate mutase